MGSWKNEEIIAEIYFGRELFCRLERYHECKCKRDVEDDEGCNRMSPDHARDIV